MSNRVNMHATGLVLDGTGLILRGRSGAGKSLLALELLDEFEAMGRKALLVSDDRVDVGVERGKLYIYPPDNIAGLIELRGRGIVQRPFAKKAHVKLVVDLVSDLDRFLEEDALVTELEGISVARCPVPERKVADSAHQRLLIKEALRALLPAESVSKSKK